MSDNVSLSRSNGSMVAHEEGARNDFDGGGLVLPHKPRIWWHWIKNHAFWYRYVVAMNSYQWKHCDFRSKGFAHAINICATRRYSQRSGERLDFYVQETLPQERQS